jgi:hypothetical protein
LQEAVLILLVRSVGRLANETEKSLGKICNFQRLQLTNANLAFLGVLRRAYS